MNKQWKDRDKISNVIRDWEFKHNFNEKDFVSGDDYHLYTKPGTFRVFYQKETKGFIFPKRVLRVLSVSPGVVIGKAGTTIDELKEALKPYNVHVEVKELREHI